MPVLRTSLVATVGLSLCFSGGANAAIWHSAAAVSTTVEHDSNPLLSSDNKTAVTRTRVAPNYKLTGTFGRDELRAGFGLHLERSSDSSIVSDREDPNLQLAWQRETETGGFGLTSGYSEISTLSEAVEQTGVVAGDGTQKTYSLGGNWSSAISERNTLANNSEYKRVEYDIDSQTSYDNVSTSFSWNYAWSERIEPFTRFALSRYEPQDSTSATSSNSYTPSAGVQLKISERLEGSVYAGVNKVSGSEGGPSGQGGVDLHYEGERFEVNFDAGRSTVASGDGGFTEVSSLSAAWSYAIDEVSRAGLSAAWQDSKGETPNTTQNFGAWASRELSPFWVTRLSLMYKQRQQDGLSDATANVLGLTLTYSHPDF
ncbi:MAG: hypothetical protein KAX95_04005 [Pseudomonas sp.]|nr:hypothetical protein [Pseudomonas sp.]